MKALTVAPGTAGSARVDDLDAPPGHGDVLVRALAVGVCGTDREIANGEYGWAPPGRERLVLGHESLGEVIEAPPDCPLAPGDLVTPVVRRPDPVPCPACAVGQWDMCRNGQYTERGIKQLDGFAVEQFLLEPEFAIRLDPSLRDVGMLVEPASVVAKAWDHIDRIGARAAWAPARVLVTGAGPIGLLAALLAVQRGFDTHVLDVVTTGPKPDLVHALGATYHVGDVDEACAGADVVVECTGVGQLVFDVMQSTAPAGIVCLTGVSSGGRDLQVDPAALNRQMVLENDVVFGTVNANRRHYEVAAQALAAADPRWLEAMITTRCPLDRWADAFDHGPDQIKAVIEVGRAS